MSGGRPFLSIVTRACKRPQMLEENIQSVKRQSCQDIEQIFIVDRKKAGIQAADRALAEHKDRMCGAYSFILDDDCWLINDYFVQELKDFIRCRGLLPVIMFKSKRPPGPPSRQTVFPTKEVWERRTPVHGTTNCLCYVIKTEIWKQWIEYFGIKPWGGDWHFLEQVINQGHALSWLDTFSGESRQLGRGQLFEKNVQKRWFEKVAKQEGLVNYGGDDWRLPLWKR